MPGFESPCCGSGDVFTITLSQPIAKSRPGDDRDVRCRNRAPLSAGRTMCCRVDVGNDNGAVNKADVNGVRNAFANETGSVTAEDCRFLADLVGSGAVGATDIKVVKKFMGKALPKIRNVPKVAVGHAFAREHQPLRHHHN